MAWYNPRDIVQSGTESLRNAGKSTIESGRNAAVSTIESARNRPWLAAPYALPTLLAAGGFPSLVTLFQLGRMGLIPGLGGAGGSGGASMGAAPSTGVRPVPRAPLTGTPYERLQQYLAGVTPYPGRPATPFTGSPVSRPPGAPGSSGAFPQPYAGYGPPRPGGTPQVDPQRLLQMVMGLINASRLGGTPRPGGMAWG